MHELPLAFHEQGLEIVIGIASLVTWSSVSDFQINDVLSCFIYQAVSVACARLKTCAHSRKKLRSTFISVERWPSLKNVNELVLLGVGVTEGRYGIGGQPRQVYTKVGETKKVTQRALFSAYHPQCERLWIDRGSRSYGCFRCSDGDQFCFL